MIKGTEIVKYLKLTTLVFLMTFPLAFAQQQQSPWHTPDKHLEWELSFFAGASFAGDKSGATPVQGQENEFWLVKLDYTSGFLAGLRLTQNINERLGAELDYTFSNQPLAFVDIKPALSRFDVEHSIHTFQYSILVYGLKSSSRFRPYGQFGGGTQLFYISGNSKNEGLVKGLTLKENWKFAVNFGGGAKYLVGKNWGFRFDVRDVISGVPDYGLPHTTSVHKPGFRPDGMLHNWQVNAGFFFSWEKF